MFFFYINAKWHNDHGKWFKTAYKHRNTVKMLYISNVRNALKCYTYHHKITLKMLYISNVRNTLKCYTYHHKITLKMLYISNVRNTLKCCTYHHRIALKMLYISTVRNTLKMLYISSQDHLKNVMHINNQKHLKNAIHIITESLQKVSKWLTNFFFLNSFLWVQPIKEAVNLLYCLPCVVLNIKSVKSIFNLRNSFLMPLENDCFFWF